MMNCLNPNKTHENKVAHSISTDGPTIVLSDASTTKTSVEVEQQATCHFCKYLLQGALLGDCRVTRLIGSGAFGDVYEAEQLPPLNRCVAIKVMSLDHVADGQSAELFAREVGAIAALDHPNILPVLRAGSLEDGRSYLVMKYAAHGSLQNYCQLTPQNLSIMPTTTPASLDAYSTRELVEHEQEDDTNDHAVQPDKPNSSDSLVLTPQQILPYVEGAAAALQQTFNFPNFTAQSISSTNAPATLRSNHSMVWDSQDNLLFVFGGVDDQGNLLTPLNSAGAHSIPGRTAAVMAWDATDQRAYIYAGAGTAKTGSTLNDLWMVTG
jgi:hypothetical protein